MSDKAPLLLNLAAFHPGTHALGPGLRAAIWVQGCPFNCPGCIAPDWIPIKPAELIDPFEMAREILQLENLDGITISGGEPMLQAEALSHMLAAVFAKKPLNVIVFSGFKLENLRHNPPNQAVSDFLDFIDVLIDGQYVDKLNEGIGLRGSSNQKIHHLTNRLLDFDFEKTPRKVELHLQDSQSFLIGIPSKQLYQAYNQALTNANLMEKPDERT